MKITNNCVASIEYTLSDENGQVIESSDQGGSPMLYLHGHGSLLPALEKSLEGKAAGDTVEVTLPPEEAFGERMQDAEQRVPLKHLAGSRRWKPGMTATVHTDKGQRQVTIIKVGHTMATVDTNHPLAGQTLRFSLQVKDVREASPEELSHGHAHGPGGHHH